ASVETAMIPGINQPAYAQASVPVDSVPVETQEVPISPPEIAPEEIVDEEDASNAPGVIVFLDQVLSPLEDVAGILYLIGDCVLVIIATTLLVAFWGGRFSQSWKLIAIAAFCLYIADMFFAYNVGLDTYEEGRLWEVFWTFSAIFFALGAAVEYEISTKSRRTSRRRRS
ncbi:MAG: hypothetical protein AAFY67_09735, partial [Cyanobacteria bacterium J06642_9]